MREEKLNIYGSLTPSRAVKMTVLKEKFDIYGSYSGRKAEK